MSKSAKEILESLDTDELQDFCYGDHPDGFETVTGVEISDQGRWSTWFEQVFKHEDGTFWRFEWNRGSTEYQDGGPEEVTFVEVEPKEVTVTQYVLKT